MTRATGLAALAVASLAVVACLAASPVLAGVATTRHNLSAAGPGTRKSTTESETCVFCHTPHNASPGGQLWNRRTGATYTPYASSTRKSTAGQPNGASMLCLSCHDGTVALGEVLSRATPIPMAGGALAGNPLLGTDLRDDHPVSFVYDSALVSARGELASPATLGPPGKVRLDAGGRLQCTACHDPHDDTNGKFLVIPNNASALCQTCHLKSNWSASDHRVSTRTWNGAGTNPWPHTSGTTVAANACESCHRPHTAGGGPRILNYAAEEANCSACHNGNVATKNVWSEFSKAYRHNVAATTGVHDPAEAAVVAGGARHVECVDCHDPHAANAAGGAMPGSLAGVRGVSIAGATLDAATREYEICLRCHGDSTGQPAPYTTRQIAQVNKRLEFQTTNPSYHPVAGVGRSSTVPSLIGPTWTTTSLVTCTDCHNNNAGPNNGGAGPNGPHGSTNWRLLERAYVTADYSSESAANYALCYKCHSRTSILSNAAGSFREHSKHIVGERTPCNVCHDPHGISGTQGSARNARLINFQTTVVTPNGGNLYWERVGTNGGRCYLTCHGRSHWGWSY